MYFIRRKWGVPVRDIWFNGSNEYKGFSLITIYYNHYKPLNGKSGIPLKNWQSQTLISDISMTTDEIQMKFKSKVRNEIRRAEKEGITTRLFYADSLLENSAISDLNKAYIAMYMDKGQKAKEIDTRLRGIAKVGKLAISVAYLADGTIGGYHSYVIGDGIARLLHSVSIFREAPEKRKLIGWANRYLHFRDMCLLREHGVSVYDWGGISREDKMLNITRFKKEFGGEIRNVYYGIYIDGN